MNYLKKMGMSLLSGAVLVLLACSDDSSTKPEPIDPNALVGGSSSDMQDPVEGGSSSSGTPVNVNVDPGLAKRLVANMGPGINLGNVFEAENNGFNKFDETQFSSNWGETIVP